MAKYQRTRQAKWDRRQLRTLTTKVRQADRDAFVDACYKTGKSPYATLRQFVLDYAYSGKSQDAYAHAGTGGGFLGHVGAAPAAVTSHYTTRSRGHGPLRRLRP